MLGGGYEPSARGKDILRPSSSGAGEKLKAIVKWSGGLNFEGSGDSGHAVMMDASKANGGTDAGSRPTELLLMALGGCTGMDVISILEKKRIKVDEFWLEISSDKTDTQPKMLTDVIVKYVFVGEAIPEKDVERAIALSTEKYCTVGAMFKASTKVEHAYEIRKP
jgi:putative redox protein